MVNILANHYGTIISLNRGLTSGNGRSGGLGLREKVNDNLSLEYFDLNDIVKIYLPLNLITRLSCLKHTPSTKRNILG